LGFVFCFTLAVEHDLFSVYLEWICGQGAQRKFVSIDNTFALPLFFMKF